MFEGKMSIMERGRLVDQFMPDFSVNLYYPPPPIIPSGDTSWQIPEAGWWKVNCDAAVDGNNAALAFVVLDDASLLVVA